eukprot:514867-Lingulodinium_polyedra.AAC.1
MVAAFDVVVELARAGVVFGGGAGELARWIPRGRNGLADVLANLAMDTGDSGCWQREGVLPALPKLRAWGN